MPDPLHPTPEELRGVLLDELSEERGRRIAEHLDGGCEECAMVMLAELGGLLYGPADPVYPANPAPADPLHREDIPAGGDAFYDAAIDLALASSLRIARRIQRERSRVPRALRLLAERGAAGFLGAVPRGLGGLAGFEALLAQSRAVRADDPAESLDLAAAAVGWAGRLPARRYGLRQRRDFECRAWLELSEAERRMENPAAARRAVGEAARRFLEGTGDEALEARLLAARADRADRSGHPRAGRALIRDGVAAVSAGETEAAVRLLGRGLAMLDRERDPELVVATVHNLLQALVGLGRFRETRALVFEYRSAFQAAYRRAARLH